MCWKVVELKHLKKRSHIDQFKEDCWAIVFGFSEDFVLVKTTTNFCPWFRNTVTMRAYEKFVQFRVLAALII